MTLRRQVFRIIEPAEKADVSSKIFDYTIISLIFLSIVAVIAESYRFPSDRATLLLRDFERVSVIAFTLEYLLRLWTADVKYPRKNYWRSLTRLIFSFMALIDLAAILPFYLPLMITLDLRFLRILRLVRLLRIFKIHRYTETLNIIGAVLKRRKEELIITFFVTFLLLLLASSLMYYIENDTQPEAFPNIIASFWWAVATLTTVGYGDVYPVTGLGKLLSGLIALLGIGLVALPTGIISSGFIEEFQGRKNAAKEDVTCPHCGKRIIR